jgi:hypothetical protein
MLLRLVELATIGVTADLAGRELLDLLLDVEIELVLTVLSGEHVLHDLVHD